MKPNQTLILGRSCKREDHSFILPSAEIAKVTMVQCSPPPPWAQSWIGGLTWVDANLIVLVDPMSLLSIERSHFPQFPQVVIMKSMPFQPHWALVVDSITGDADDGAYVSSLEMQSDGQTRPVSSFLPFDWHCPQNWFSTVVNDIGKALPLLNVNIVSKAVETGYRLNFAA